MHRKTYPAARAAAAVLTLGSFACVLLSWFRLEENRQSFFVSAKSALSAWDSSTEATILLIAGTLLALGALISMIFTLAGRWGGAVFYALTSLLAFGDCFYLTGHLEHLRPALHLDLGAWLCPALALAALVCVFIRPAPAASDAPVWLCPGCGRLLSEQESVCPVCGSRRFRQVRRCAVCGAELAVNAAFCPNCGASAD